MNTNSVERFKVDVGKLWTFIIRSAMVSTVMNMRNEYQPVPALMACNSEVTGVPVPLPPSWLSDLTSGVRPGATLTDLVHAVVNEEEEGRRVSSLSSGDGESEASGRCKRQKTSGGAEDKNSVDTIVLRKLYSSIRNYLGGTRTPCRILLYSELLFLTERISNSFRSEAEAYAAGYRISFGKESRMDEGDPSICDFTDESVWNVKNTHVFSGSNQDKVESNNTKFQNLQALFPSFQVMLEYPRKVVYSPRDKSDEFPEHNTVGLQWHQKETVSLHEVAKKLLLEAVRMKEADELFQSSSYSLKAVHIIALAIRGLVKKQLKRRLSDIEATALGACTCEKTGA